MQLILDNLKRYCQCNSPSGLEDEIRAVIINDLNKAKCEFSVDSKGNILAFKKGKHKRNKKVLLSAHMDEVGFMVTYISKDGLIRFAPVGGMNPYIAIGKRVVFCKGSIYGTILAKPIHLQQRSEIGRPSKFEDLYIDIGNDSKPQSEDIQIGDYFCFDSEYFEFGQGYIKSKAVDDRFGCAMLMDIINSSLLFDTYFAFTTCEETGLDGACIIAESLKPDIVIVIESTTANDVGATPPEDKACVLGSGAVVSLADGGTVFDESLIDLVESVANKNNITIQVKNVIAGGNEARAFQYQVGAKVLAISAPTRYIHSPSCVVFKDDLYSVSQLLHSILKEDF